MREREHDFEQSLRLSESYEDAPWWEMVYRQAFAGYDCMVSVRRDTVAQRQGIDRLVLLTNGEIVRVDEKVRPQDWSDFCLEIYSDEARQTPSWLTKPGVRCDYVAYAFVPSRRCFLLPFRELARAWRTRGETWWTRAETKAPGYRFVRAPNPGYLTLSVAVPIEDVLIALANVMEVTW